MSLLPTGIRSNKVQEHSGKQRRRGQLQEREGRSAKKTQRGACSPSFRSAGAKATSETIASSRNRDASAGKPRDHCSAFNSLDYSATKLSQRNTTEAGGSRFPALVVMPQKSRLFYAVAALAAVIVILLPSGLYIASTFTVEHYESERQTLTNAFTMKSPSLCFDYRPAQARSPAHSELPFIDMDEITPYKHVIPSRNAIFCVYENDVLLRYSKLRYRVNDVPGSYCTHLIYYKAGVTAEGNLYSKDPVIDERYRGYKAVAELKNVYTHLKVLLAIGGGPHVRDTAQFSSLAADLNRTRSFADRAYWWLVNQGFDGIHLDWRQPGGDCGRASDKQHYLRLVETLRERFGTRFLLTVGVPYQDNIRHRGFHLPGIADNANYILITSHDLYNATTSLTHCPSPYMEQNRSGPTVYDVVHKLKYEIPREHREILCFTVSLRGVFWTLQSTSSFAVGSQATSPGPPVGNTQTAGVMEYPRVCRYHMKDTVDKSGLCSFAVHLKEWVSYEGTQTLPLKLSRMRKDMGTGGLCLAVWDLEMDDFGAECDRIRSPLLRAIYSALSGFKV